MTDSTVHKFLNEHDDMKREIASLRAQVAARDDELRAASLELEKGAIRIDFMVEQLTSVQEKADRWQRIAERALTKLETIGNIMLNGISDVLSDVKAVEYGDRPRVPTKVRQVEGEEVEGGPTAAEMAARLAPEPYVPSAIPKEIVSGTRMSPGDDPRLPRPTFGSGPRRT